MILFFIFSLALFLRIVLSFQFTYWVDMNSWIGWSNRLVEVGFRDFYQTWSDYLPGYLYVLWVLGHLKNFFLAFKLTIPNELLYKMPSMLADLGTTYLIFKLIEDFKNKKIALITSLIYLFNPAIWGNSTLWGQADSFFAFVIFLSFYCLVKNNIFLSAAILGVACIIKPLALFLLPFVLLFLFVKKKIKFLLVYLLITLAFIIFPFIPFSSGSLLRFIWQRFKITFNQYPYISLNAFNFWGVLSFLWRKDNLKFLNLSFKSWGVVLFGIAYLITLLLEIKSFLLKKVKKEKETYFLFLTSGLVLFASFLFLTRIHERHLLPAFPFLNLAVCFNPLIWPIYLFSSLIYILNLTYAYVWLTNNFKSIFSPFTIQTFSLFQLINFVLLLKVCQRFGFSIKNSSLIKIFKRWEENLKTEKRSEKQKIVKKGKLYLILILLFAFIIRIWNIWYPRVYVFDEVYHGFTAQEMAKGNVKAWEWWNTPPKGFAYEWTHPPLAKLIMASGILFFGKNDQVSQYAFRFPGIIFGLGIIYLTYLLAVEVFKNEKIGLLAALLLSFDGLLFVMSRIGMADVYFLFFLLATILLALKERYFWSGIFLGLSLATKWTGVYLYLVISIILLCKFRVFTYKFTGRKTHVNSGYLHIIRLLFAFSVIPAVVYLLSYTLFFTSGHNWRQFIELQRQMWWYHTHLKATHNYQSKAWTWPLMLRPVWFWVDYKPDKVGNIYNFGNPIIWWSGLLVLPFAIHRGVKEFIEKKNFWLLFIIFCYFAFWLPWIFSPRIMFLHHYLPAIPFLCILISWFLVKIQKWRKSILFTAYYLLLTTLIFFFFYPIYTGVLIPKDLVKYFFWFPSWR